VPTDFDLHGIVGLRLVDPAPEDVSTISAELGLVPQQLERAPDIVLRFVDRVPSSGPLRRVGSSAAAFDDDAFLLLRSARGGRPCARMPFERLGMSPCEIVCERGCGVPLLGPILGVTALGRGWVPVHASAFVFGGVGTIAAGWAGGGKTGTLLAFMAAGARYVSDDWVYIRRDGAEMRGLPAPLEVKGDYLDQLPLLRSRVESGMRSGQRLRTAALRRARWAGEALAGGSQRLTTVRLRAALERRSRASVAPEALFGREACPLAGRLDRVLLVLTHDAPDVRVAAADSASVGRRLAFALEHEWQALLGHYLQFRFAFPDRPNPVLEDRDGTHAAVVRALADKPAHVVSHPSTAPIRDLFDALEPVVGG